MIRSTLRRRSGLALAAAGFGLALAIAPVAAQTAQPAPAQPAPAPSAAPQPLPGTPTASHVAAARDVIQASGLARSFDFLVPQMMDQLRNAFAQTRPEIMDELTKTMLALRPEFESQREEVLQAAAKVYATYLTEAELKDISAFFKSPSGARYVNTQPPLLDQLYTELQSWNRKTSDQMLARVRAEMKKKNIEM
jgi:uncharacterized protein